MRTPVNVQPTGDRTEEKQMEDICLESEWGRKLTSLGWSDNAVQNFLHHWAPSTRKQYNFVIAKFTRFCDSHHLSVYQATDNIVAEFLSHIAAQSSRPKSQVFGSVSALQALYSALDHNPITSHIRHVAEGIVKCSTVVAMQKTCVMPISPFVDLFNRWPDNSHLTLKQLRLKTICLMALIFMLRPSDIAPRSQIRDPISGHVKNVVFSTSNLDFLPDGSLKGCFHGPGI